MIGDQAHMGSRQGKVGRQFNRVLRAPFALVQKFGVEIFINWIEDKAMGGDLSLGQCRLEGDRIIITDAGVICRAV